MEVESFGLDRRRGYWNLITCELIHWSARIRAYIVEESICPRRVDKINCDSGTIVASCPKINQIIGPRIHRRQRKDRSHVAVGIRLSLNPNASHAFLLV